MPDKLSRTELYLREILCVLMHGQSRDDGLLLPSMNCVWELLSSEDRSKFRRGVDAAIDSLEARQRGGF